MKGDFTDEAMRYRDIDIAATKRAKREIKSKSARTVRRVRPPNKSQSEICHWKLDEHCDTWSTECGFTIDDSDTRKDLLYCQGCGKLADCA